MSGGEGEYKDGQIIGRDSDKGIRREGDTESVNRSEMYEESSFRGGGGYNKRLPNRMLNLNVHRRIYIGLDRGEQSDGEIRDRIILERDFYFSFSSKKGEGRRVKRRTWKVCEVGSCIKLKKKGGGEGSSG